MEKIGLDLDEGMSTDSPLNPQEARRLSIQRCIQSLVHACNCHDLVCRIPSCQKMKRVMTHTKSCRRKTNGGMPGVQAADRTLLLPRQALLRPEMLGAVLPDHQTKASSTTAGSAHATGPHDATSYGADAEGHRSCGYTAYDCRSSGLRRQQTDSFSLDGCQSPGGTAFCKESYR